MQAFHHDNVDSTNEEAKRLFHAGQIERRAYIHARAQTAGKGNRNRSWVSPRDAGIYISVIECAPHHDAPPDTLFTAAAGVACALVLREWTGIDVRLKPVNDLYAAGRKLGGILVESLVESGRMRAVITGIGINTHEAERPVPQGSAVPVNLQQLMTTQAFNALQLDEMIAALAKSALSWNRPCWEGKTKEVQTAWNSLSLPGSKLPD